MLLINFIFLFLTSAVFAAEVGPLQDNVLFAFERCQSLSVDLKKGGIMSTDLPGFDMHCKATIGLEFKCDYIDIKTNKRAQLEVFNGGKNGSRVALSSKGGSSLKFLLGNQSAYYETPLTDSENISGRKVCSGIFLLEKDARKHKK
ncbi:hypothetical protein ACJVC5_06955 [Peredibacter sp. HCB2-198]|uniref:hypothetical protein n=1 Tax=Peredibacter sp. HCB2-198 TaxID=3383025 RepID=UPI0038B60501